MYNQLTREQRYAIYLGLQEGRSQKAIAQQINVNPSTISREISRNKNRFGRYAWTAAHDKAMTRRERLPYGKNPQKVAETAVRLLLPYKRNVHSITTDNGTEFSCHQVIAEKLKTTVYFADSYSSWQKGTIKIQIN